MRDLFQRVDGSSIIYKLNESTIKAIRNDRIGPNPNFSIFNFKDVAEKCNKLHRHTFLTKVVPWFHYIAFDLMTFYLTVDRLVNNLSFLILPYTSKIGKNISLRLMKTLLIFTFKFRLHSLFNFHSITEANSFDDQLKRYTPECWKRHALISKDWDHYIGF